MNSLKEKFLNKKFIIVSLCVIIAIVAVTIIIKTCITTYIKNAENKRLEEFNAIFMENIYAPYSSIAISGNKENVDGFLEKFNKMHIEKETKDDDECFNITPKFIKENSEYEIYKFANSAETFVLYQDEIYKIGNNKRGMGTISFALADTNDDELKELFYVSYWSISSVLRSSIAYFDPIKKEEVQLSENYTDEVLIFTTNNQNSELIVNTSSFSGNKVENINFKMIPNKEKGIIINHENQVKLATRVEIERIKTNGR